MLFSSFQHLQTEWCVIFLYLENCFLLRFSFITLLSNLIESYSSCLVSLYRCLLRVIFGWFVFTTFLRLFMKYFQHVFFENFILPRIHFFRTRLALSHMFGKDCKYPTFFLWLYQVNKILFKSVLMKKHFFFGTRYKSKQFQISFLFAYSMRCCRLVPAILLNIYPIYYIYIIMNVNNI